MTRVAYIGNFEPPHSTENHVAQALESLGHAVQRRQEQVSASWLIDGDPPPDVVLWTRTKSLSDQIPVGVRDELVATCERRGIPTVGYHLDRWWGLKREYEIHAGDPFFNLTLLCTADGGHDRQWDDAAINHAWFPPAVSEFECVPGRYDPMFDSRVAFVGSWSSYGHSEWWPQRRHMIEQVVGWYGPDFACWPVMGEPAVRGEELRNLYASAQVIVGDSCLAPTEDGKPITRYWSDRIPETLGRGGILVHPEVLGLPLQLPMFTYPLGNMDYLHSQIEQLLDLNDGERARMRQRCVEYVRSHDTYTHRMRSLWKLLGL